MTDTRGTFSRVIPWRPTTVALCAVSIVLVVISGLTFVGHTVTAEGTGVNAVLREARILMDVGAETNVPTWYASLLWALLAVAALLAARVSPSRKAAWAVLAVVAGAASIDEYSQLHERLAVIGDPIAAALGWELWYTWIIPGALIAIAVVVLLLPLVMSLPALARRLLLAGGALFVAGAIGLEFVGGLVADSTAPAWAYILVTMIEETFEMLGVALAIGGVLVALQVMLSSEEVREDALAAPAVTA